MSKLIETRKQDRNGVRVRVKVYDFGTTVEAACQCFGSEKRLHSRVDCPLRLRLLAGK